MAEVSRTDFVKLAIKMQMHFLRRQRVCVCMLGRGNLRAKFLMEM